MLEAAHEASCSLRSFSQGLLPLLEVVGLSLRVVVDSLVVVVDSLR